MAEEEETPPSVPEGDAHKLKEVVIFTPAGAYTVAGDMAQVECFPNGVMYVDVVQKGGSIERFVGCPFVMKLGTNRLVQPVSAIIKPA